MSWQPDEMTRDGEGAVNGENFNEHKEMIRDHIQCQAPFHFQKMCRPVARNFLGEVHNLPKRDRDLSPIISESEIIG